MRFKLNQVSNSQELVEQSGQVVRELLRRGHELIDGTEPSDFVLNLFDLDAPAAHRRRGQEEMVISLALAREVVPDMKSACFTGLIKSISNMLFCLCEPPGGGGFRGCSITPEAGFTEFSWSPAKVVDGMSPVIGSHFVIRNKLSADLEGSLDRPIPEVDDLIAHARDLKALGVMPSPFPLTRFLDDRSIAHVFRLYEIKGLSYGNLSIRNDTWPAAQPSFWMTARGVDKSRLKGIGQDVLLVTGYDEDAGQMAVSVPPEHDPSIRVSVDAIEHLLIYRAFPETGAIVHVHGWIDGVPCTDQAYPCGTAELARSVVALLGRADDPGRAAVGLKNHGITITGPDIRDIVARLRRDLKTSVPMFN